MGKNIPPPSPTPPPTHPGALHHHLPSARILLNHRDIHPACLSLCFGLSVTKPAMLLSAFFFFSLFLLPTCLCLRSILNSTRCLSPSCLPSVSFPSARQSALHLYSGNLFMKSVHLYAFIFPPRSGKYDAMNEWKSGWGRLIFDTSELP